MFLCRSSTLAPTVVKCGRTRQSIDPLLGKTLSVIGRQSIEGDSSIPRAIARMKGQESFGLQVHRRVRDESLKLEWLELVASGLVELASEFDPGETNGVEERAEALHAAQDGDREAEPEAKGEHGGDGTRDARHAKHVLDGHGPQHLGQLGVGKRQGPQTEIGGSVGDTAEAELDGVDHLVNDHLADVELVLLLHFSVAVAAAAMAVALGLGEAAVLVGVVVVIVTIAVEAEAARAIALVADGAVALALGGLVLLPLDVGRDAEHPGYADEGNEQEDGLYKRLTSEELGLGINVAGLEEHVDEHVEQARRVVAEDGAVCVGLVPVDGPLVDDGEDEVAKERLHEEHLGHDLGPDLPLLTEADEVGHVEKDGERHVEDAEDDGHLHLERVGEDKRIVGAVPGGVDADGVGVAIGDGFDGAVLVGPVPAGVEEVHALASNVVVEEAGEHGEDTHEKHHVATVEEHGEDLVVDLGELALKGAHGESSERHEEGVEDVAEHDGKEERKQDEVEETRVDLLVLCDAVAVADGLDGFGVLVGALEGGRRLVGAQFLKHGRGAGACVLGGATKGELDLAEIARGAPAFGNERLATVVEEEHVERGVDELLLAHDILPGAEHLGDLDELGATGGAGGVEHIVEVLDAAEHLAEALFATVGVAVDGVEGAPHALADLANLGEEFGTVCKDDEDVLADGFLLCGIVEGFFDLGVVHVEVAAKHAPEDALEDGHL
ncbi:hypothetical protein L1887_42606 [Cichorium endivia]|nr:hypothetical protein L1887_42606 [Cichorium endivia]